jgi:hypothetical protein
VETAYRNELIDVQQVGEGVLDAPAAQPDRALIGTKRGEKIPSIILLKPRVAQGYLRKVGLAYFSVGPERTTVSEDLNEQSRVDRGSHGEAGHGSPYGDQCR